ncbi:MAG: MATE family efflux transporter, partial [Alistipes sp.]|nr:MATE family efflux transporter [Alistipes sp.]
GAAAATVLSQTAAFLLCAVYMWRKYDFLRIRKEDLKIDRVMAKRLLTSGLSMGFMQSLVSLGTVSLQSAINTFGTNIIVAHSAARKITELFMLPFSVFGMTMTTYCGQNLGAGRIDRIKAGIRDALLLAWGWCALVVLASYTVAPFLIRAVTAATEEEVIATASLYLRVDTVLYFVTAVITVFRNALQGIGDCVVPVISSFIELAGKVLVVVFLTPRLAYWGIILAEPIVWVLMVIPLIIRVCTIKVLKTPGRERA